MEIVIELGPIPLETLVVLIQGYEAIDKKGRSIQQTQVLSALQELKRRREANAHE